MKKYTIGLDFGTLSGRAVLVDISTGEIISTSVYDYSNKVIEDFIPNTNISLGIDYALQDPQDYIDVVKNTIEDILLESKIDKDQIIGIGIDFTACTVVAVDKYNDPLCFNKEYRNNPHSWVKLWKHHSAQKYADKLNELAHNTNVDWIKRYGGKISSEWLFPKIIEVAIEDNTMYELTDNYLEATDWITSQLTGNIVRNTCTLGYKAIYHHENGFPSNDFFVQLDSRLDNIVKKKIKGEFRNIGESAGTLSQKWADLLNLNESTIVAVGNVDAHVSAPAVNVVNEGSMLMIMGTSTCDILLGKEEKVVPGMCGVVKDGVIPGYFGYESGQSAVGDIFAWFTDSYINKELLEEAENRNLNIHQLLTEKADQLEIGESGLVALDWFGGNRSVLVDMDLQGIILGMTLQTKPEEIYRALIESTAFGKKVIVDNFIKSGVDIKEMYVCGGLPNKNAMLLQIYADVLNIEIRIADSLQTPALGSAIFASVAAKDNGGYDSITEASKFMAKVKDQTVKPIKENVLMYKKIYNEFVLLHDYFGRGTNDVMKRLKKIKNDQRSK